MSLSVLVAVVLAAQPGSSVEAATAYAACFDVKVRSAPSPQSQIKGELRFGERVQVLELTTSGARRIETSRGLSGWVDGSGLRDQPFPNVEPSGIRIAVPGLIQTDSEIKAGEAWTALVTRDVPSIGVRPVLAPVETVVRDYEGVDGRKMLSATGPGSPTLLIRGFSGLKPEAMRTFTERSGFLFPGQHSQLAQTRDGERWGTLAASGCADSDGNLSRYRLNLQYGKKRAVLWEWPALSLAYAGEMPEVVWAGDMDGDEKTDLLLQVSTDNWARYVLMLSSFAADGRLVEPVASYVPASI